jgi:GT2 family glycosyltransferase
MKIELSVIIVNYNGVHYLKDCIDSLCQNLSNIAFEIIILDNNSTDDSRAYLITNFPEVKLIESKINHGFGKGNNEAVKSAEGSYLLLINNDTVVLDSISPVLEILKSDATIGVIGINMLNGKKEYLPAAGIFPNFQNMFQMNKLLQIGTEFNSGNFSNDKYEVDWLGGSFLLLRRETYDKINGFDEDYEITGYGEDCDIEWRMLKQGFSFLHLKYRAIQFHLFHERPNREDQTAISRKLFNKKKQEGISFCKNGITKIKS